MRWVCHSARSTTSRTPGQVCHRTWGRFYKSKPDLQVYRVCASTKLAKMEKPLWLMRRSVDGFLIFLLLHRTQKMLQKWWRTQTGIVSKLKRVCLFYSGKVAFQTCLRLVSSKNTPKIIVQVVCGKSKYGEVLDALCGVEEFLGEIKRQSSKCLWLINQAIANETGDSDLRDALAKIKATFASLGSATKVKLNNHLVTVVDSLMVKVHKDKLYFVELSKGGVQRDEILCWTNMRLGITSSFLWTLILFQNLRSGVSNTLLSGISSRLWKRVLW